MNNFKEKTKNALMGLVLIAMMYMIMVMMFILDGAPFHQQWLSGFYLNGINIVQNVFVDIEWSQQIEEKMYQKIVGNVYGKNVVGNHINQVMVSYIGLKNEWKNYIISVCNINN